MKKVTLLGDSIRLGYESRVTELLKPDFEVFTYKDNGRFAAYTLRSLFDYREQIAGSDVIHWNNGHWDLCDLFGDGIFHLDRSVHRLSPAHRRPAARGHAECDLCAYNPGPRRKHAQLQCGHS